MKVVFGEEKAEEISPIAVGDRVVVYDPHPIKKGAEPVYGKEGIFASVENSSVVVVLEWMEAFASASFTCFTCQVD
uniref:Uncharacterized protein n=1 Tax=Chromera velia CCMP2878 TaxID=1169474 RepID=A0A0G4H4N1_9ALVE|eukprot:Cvel_24622.t1-p1 / transcript=Cvel_24622.t1 / gene=Cvel_24622 / organism=Chromera_velia_CCMP2878 / gene_product=hypothetical protein / transcript_product=hypothetical protein / location=Cvel_scaffold2684:20768-23245(+) / protein_length=75 / sequence_SO=supercontig / SO=protein_coding / is_pseudo=false